MRHRHAGERGSTMLLVILILIALTGLGLVVMRGVVQDTDVAGAERASEEALAVAEAGLVWAQREIERRFGDPLDPSKINFDAIAAGLSTTNDASICVRDCGSTWRLLSSAAPGELFGNGNYLVAVKLDSSAGVRELVVRSRGSVSSGTARLLEVVMTDR